MHPSVNVQRGLDRAVQAKAILENPLYIEAWENVRRDIFRKWETAPMDAAHERELLWMMLAGVNRVQMDLKSIVKNGKIIERELELEREQNEQEQGE